MYLKELDDGDLAPVMVEMYQVKVTEVQGNFKERGSASWPGSAPMSSTAGTLGGAEIDVGQVQPVDE